MSVKIRIPDTTGDTTQCVPVTEAQNIASRMLNQKYLMSINGSMSKQTKDIQDGDSVQFYPAIAGG